MKVVVSRQHFEDPSLAKMIFGSPVMGFAWFFLRLYLGYQWIEGSLHKIFGTPAIGWVKDGVVNGKEVHAGDSLMNFWANAVKIPAPPARPAITFGWYREFLQFLLDHKMYTWMTYVISYGELLVGIGLVVGAFTGIAAFFGATMNLNFMFAGSASSNPLLFTVAILVLLAWKTAGYVGVDRWILPMVGTPWHAGKIFHRVEAAPVPRPGVTGAGA